MRLPLSWLREWCDLPVAVPEIAERLTMAGIEVEQIIPIGEGLEGVIVAEVREVSPHPAAERLRACVVFDGERDRSIVCGAGNVRPGLRTPLALPGAVLPDGRRIETTVLRGVRSEGMLCSAAELGLGGAWRSARARSRNACGHPARAGARSSGSSPRAQADLESRRLPERARARARTRHPLRSGDAGACDRSGRGAQRPPPGGFARSAEPAAPATWAESSRASIPVP